MKQALNEHKKQDRAKWTLTFFLFVVLFAAILGSLYFSLYLYWEGDVPGLIPVFESTTATEQVSADATTTVPTSATEQTSVEPQAEPAA